jgi:hypothetical protein
MLEVRTIHENVCQPTALRHRRTESSATPQSEHQIFSKTAVTTSNFQQYRSQNIKSSAKSLSQPQIFSNTAVRTSNLQQDRCHNLKSSAIPQ